MNSMNLKELIIIENIYSYFNYNKYYLKTYKK